MLKFEITKFSTKDPNITPDLVMSFVNKLGYTKATDIDDDWDGDDNYDMNLFDPGYYGNYDGDPFPVARAVVYATNLTDEGYITTDTSTDLAWAEFRVFENDVEVTRNAEDVPVRVCVAGLNAMVEPDIFFCKISGKDKGVNAYETSLSDGWDSEFLLVRALEIAKEEDYEPRLAWTENDYLFGHIKCNELFEWDTATTYQL